MNWIIVVYVLLHVVLFAISTWILILPQAVFWRVAFGVVWLGSVWNTAGLIWLGYSVVWPGEPFVAAGVCLVLAGLLFFKRPLVVRRILKEIGHDQSTTRSS